MTHPLFLRVATAVVLALGMSTLGAYAAVADQNPPLDASSTTGEMTSSAADVESSPAAEPATAPYKLLAWQLPCGIEDRFCAPGQLLVHVLDLETPTLDAFDDIVIGTCSDWQIDLELNSPTTDALIAAGVLTGPNSPIEDHAYGVLGAGVDPYKTIDNPNCAVEGSVATGAVATDQTCVAGTLPPNGEIAVIVTPGVAYTITGPQGVVALDPATGIAGGLTSGAYSVSYLLDPSLTTPDPGPIALTIAAPLSACSTIVTPPTALDASADDPALDPPITGAATCSVSTAPDADCQLRTLASTGSDPRAVIASGSLLILAGAVALVLSRRRRRRGSSTEPAN